MDTQTPVADNRNLTPDRPMDEHRYRQIIQDLLQDIVQRSQATPSANVRTVPVFDEAHNQYQILDIGWDESGQRVFQPIVHVELLHGKIWIQENATDIDLAKALLDWNVSASEIVLGLHSKSLRRFSEYAVE
jgi:hypothetical protein